MSVANQNSTPSPEATLMWSATRYVLGEMVEAERDAWEEILLNDFEACAAVAQATQLVLGIDAACRALEPMKLAVPQASPGSATRRSRQIRASPSVIALTMTLAATLLAGFSEIFTGSPDSHHSPTSEQLAAARLVGLWQEGSSLIPTSARADVVEAGEWDDVEADEVPQWLIAAVSLEAGRPLEETDAWEEN